MSEHPLKKILCTERLILREIQSSDWEAIHRYASHPGGVRYMEWGPNSEGDTKAFVETVIAEQEAIPRRGYDLAIVLKETSRLIGTCSLRLSGGDLEEAEIGYCLSRAVWNKGYATEAVAGIIHFGRETLGVPGSLPRLILTTPPLSGFWRKSVW